MSETPSIVNALDRAADIEERTLGILRTTQERIRLLDSAPPHLRTDALGSMLTNLRGQEKEALDVLRGIRAVLPCQSFTVREVRP